MQEGKEPEHIIVIGASAGGLNAITEVVSQLKKEWNIAVFVVIYLSKVSLGEYLAHRLQKYTSFICAMPVDGEIIEAGHIYLARPDLHLMVKNRQIALGSGPAENRWRPSIDVLFRSAAAEYANRVVGIVMTGFLNDGVSGMWAIKRSGGSCIVQDPNEAEYPDMPLAVLDNMEVDECISLSKMGEAIEKLIQRTDNNEVVAPPEVVREAAIAQNEIISLEKVSEVGSKELYACPDCGGGLWSVDNEIVKRYRCHVGHSYTEMDLLIRQSESLEATLWVALRMMEERRILLRKIANGEKDKGLNRLSSEHYSRAEELEAHIEKLKHLLFSTKD